MGNDAKVSEGFFSRLRRNRVVQWTLAYAAGAWLLLQVAELLFDVFVWPEPWLRRFTVLLFFGFAAVSVLAWYHGRRGAQSIAPGEVVLLALIAAGAAWALASSEFATEGDLERGGVAPVRREIEPPADGGAGVRERPPGRRTAPVSSTSRPSPATATCGSSTATATRCS